MSETAPRTLDSILSTWQPQLSRGAGASKLLAGLDVYYDFAWRVVIGHGKMTFTNGKDLAERIKDDCPEGMTPALLLTTRDDVEEGQLRTTDGTYLFVIHIGRYLAKAAAGAAVNYLAGELGVGGLAAMRRAKKKTRDPARLDEILEDAVTEERLGRWVDRNPRRVAMLQEIVDSRTTHAGGREDVPAARTAAKRLIRSVGPAAVQGVADELASTPEGRRAVASSNQLPGRIEDVRVASREYRNLLAKPGATETELQGFIEKNPLLLGLEYAEVIPRQRILRGEIDFLVRRHDGYHDLLELKGPHDPILLCDGEEARPSSYSLAPNLARALAQVNLYREWLTTTASETLELYGIKRTRDPRVTIVIGLASALPNETAKRILIQLNMTLHRMEVVPYDILSDRARLQLSHLATFAEAPGAAGGGGASASTTSRT